MPRLNSIATANAQGRVFRVCIAFHLLLGAATFLAVGYQAPLHAQELGKVMGSVTDPRGSVVVGARVGLSSPGESSRKTRSNARGEFVFEGVRPGVYTLTAESPGFTAVEKSLSITPGQTIAADLQFLQLESQKSVVIVSSTSEPGIDRRNSEIYQKTLFERDDQLLETLNAGINAGQHEGGGKSIEIRRFGFNLDHGGTNGGLKIVVNDLPQNQASQGHGQGYLGALKALTPELVQEVNILNGPFSAEYGDFSGLGVVQIRTRENLPDRLTLRAQAGSFDSYRTFLAYSPAMERVDSFFAYESSYTNGPFLSHLRYKRNNLTGNYTLHMSNNQALGFKANFGTNDFDSSGQVPLDLVAAGQLDRFGFIDPSDGGRVRLGTASVYYSKLFGTGDSLKADAFLGRSLFDLYSNFTFFLKDRVHGDGFQQHDSRYQEGANMQYMHFYSLKGARGLLTLGTNFHDNQVNVGLYPREARVPLGVTARSYLVFPNFAGYAQHGLDLLQGRLHLETGLRWDSFRWSDRDRVDPSQSGVQSASKTQPKAAVAYTPSRRIPLTLSFNYGRGINTQDARGIIERPDSPRIATTDFFQVGTIYNRGRISLSADEFLIDRSNEQVYIPDDGTFELKGPSRSYGYEAKTSLHVTRHLILNGGLTQVTNSFYRGVSPRLYVDSAPHTVGDAGMIFSGWHGVFASLRYRHIGNYRLDELDPRIRASGLDVLDLSLTKQLHRWIDLNLGVDNLTNKRYYETQNYFESRVTPDSPALFRIHGTPGYPFNFILGLSLHLWAKAP